LLIRGIFRKVDWDEDLLGFGIDITNIDTAFVREQNPVTLRRENKVSTWHVKDKRFIGGRIEDGVEQKTGPARDGQMEPTAATIKHMQMQVRNCMLTRSGGCKRCGPSGIP
jgi:hypothetical protein